MTTSARTAVTTRLLSGFDDPAFPRERWNGLLGRGPTNVVFLTWEFQRAWWESFGDDRLLLLVAAERDGEVVALAPFHADEWSISLLGQGEAEWLDVIGDADDPEVLEALLAAARDSAPDGADFNLAMLPGADRLAQLNAAADRLGLATWELADDLIPTQDLRRPDAADVLRKKSLVRHERALRREGELVFEHVADGAEIAAGLDAFFDQHVERWAATEYPSRFEEERDREFIRRLTGLASESGWLRFTRVVWEGRPVAFHFGFCYGGRFHWWRPSFDVALARRSPGEVLLGSLIRRALDEHADVFDFGLGPLPFKLRFATAVDAVGYWGTE